MSQHDYVISNQDGASFRADINDALASIVSCNSGPTAPTATFAYQVWHDTTTGIIKQRNAGNTAWLNLSDVLLAGKTINGLLTYTNQITHAAVQAATSGTVKDFLDIPSWAKRITVMLNSVSTSGTSSLLFQIGTSSGIQSSGYSTANSRIGATAVIAASQSAGWALNSGTAASTMSGILTLGLVDASTGIWAGSGLFGSTEPATTWTGGSKTLSGTLDRVRITTVNGTDTFDAGSVNIIYE